MFDPKTKLVFTVSGGICFESTKEEIEADGKEKTATAFEKAQLEAMRSLERMRGQEMFVSGLTGNWFGHTVEINMVR